MPVYYLLCFVSSPDLVFYERGKTELVESKRLSKKAGGRKDFEEREWGWGGAGPLRQTKDARARLADLLPHYTKDTISGGGVEPKPTL